MEKRPKKKLLDQVRDIIRLPVLKADRFETLLNSDKRGISQLD